MTPDPTELLPNWYLKFLNTYDTLKNDICTYYLGMNLEKIHDRLATCTLLRLDDRNNGNYLSIDDQTKHARQFLQSYFPEFPYTDQCVTIAWNGYCNYKKQWEPYSDILVVKDGNKHIVYTINTDDTGMKPVLVSKSFNTFFVNLNEMVAKAQTFIQERKVPYRRENGEIVPASAIFNYVDVQLKGGKALDDILKEENYLHFDAEGFITASEYEDVLKQLLNMTGLDYQLETTNDKPILDLRIKSTQYTLPVETASDYFDETLIDRLNTVLEAWKLKKKFQVIFPYTTGNVDQGLAIGYCSSREIEVLRKNRYVQ